MRRILIDRARMRQATKRGGDMEHIELQTDIVSTAQRDDRLLQLDAALAAFEDEDSGKARLVELRFFAGLSIPDVAEHLGISVATANRHWAYARAWLKREMDR
jgi:RNA polymerase sigma factor (TIGR02999 family)